MKFFGNNAGAKELTCVHNSSGRASAGVPDRSSNRLLRFSKGMINLARWLDLDLRLWLSSAMIHRKKFRYSSEFKVCCIADRS